MPNDAGWHDNLVRGEGEALAGGANYRGRMAGDRTFINMGALAGRYKLAAAYADVRNLEFRSDRAAKIETFHDYLGVYGERLRLPGSAERKPRPSYPADEGYRNTRSRRHYPRGELLVLVDQPVYDAVAHALDTYVLDVGRDGWWATVHVLSGYRPAMVRRYIASHAPKGVLLVGAIAAPWYEIGTDNFPCDLYYMDTNGTWSDPDGDGKFDGHTGNLDPEIWVGRLWTPTAGGNDATLLVDYLHRNHRYRLGGLGHARSALAYVDDDWTGFDDCALDLAYPASAVTKYTDPAATDADLYKAEVNSLRSWVQLCAHSWVQGHALRVTGGDEYIDHTYFRDTNPPNAHFYNLFCCGPGRYPSADYLAGWYLFDKKGGGVNPAMAVVASAKSGSMLFFEDFYRPLGQGKVIGDAYVDWWRARGPDHEDWEREWFYGLALLGDPTLAWWSGAVPSLVHPQAADVFNHWPRRMQLRWNPVQVPGATYSVEVDALGAVNAGAWAEATGQTFFVRHGITETTLDHTFVGAQRGRWRVRADVGGQACRWSPWSYFRFTV